MTTLASKSAQWVNTQLAITKKYCYCVEMHIFKSKVLVIEGVGIDELDLIEESKLYICKDSFKYAFVRAVLRFSCPSD